MTGNKDSMYVKACVVANGVRDLQGDVITKKDIKKIFTNSIDVGFDIGHDNIRQTGIYSLENYISKEEEQLGDNIVPSGSWMTVLRIDNDEIQEKIKKHEINGVSITAYPEHDAEITKHGNGRPLLYKDIVAKDQLHPREISLVGRPANNLPLDVMDYNTYLSKSVNFEDETMSTHIEKEESNKDSTINKLVDILSAFTHKSEDVTEEQEPISKEEVEPCDGCDKCEECEEDKSNDQKSEESEQAEGEEAVDKSDDSEVSGDPTEVSKAMPMAGMPQQGAGGQPVQGGAEQALIQIAQICAKFLEAGQQPQQPAMQQPIARSSEPVETEVVAKSDDESLRDANNDSDDKESVSVKKSDDKISKKETQKFDAEGETMVDHSDVSMLFAQQQGRDPYTFEKL